jgi:peptide-methionine (R)-S-oxide reductase
MRDKMISTSIALAVVAAIAIAVSRSDFAVVETGTATAADKVVEPAKNAEVRETSVTPEAPAEWSVSFENADTNNSPAVALRSLVGQKLPDDDIGGEDVSDKVFDGRRVERTAEEWKRILTAEQFHILREKGTEQPYTGVYADSKQKGIYACAGCGLHLFSSKAKFDSGTGWPSFFRPVNKRNIAEEIDKSIAAEVRTEVLCARCGGHLGHVFDDGPRPTGLRYCINSAALKFVKRS